MKPIPADPAFVARFRANIGTADPVDGCELWQGMPGDDGYGTFSWQGDDNTRWKYRAHRLALTLAEPAPFPDAYALHGCDTPLCCSTAPGHLYWGTARDNAADRDRPLRRSQLRDRRLARNGQLSLFASRVELLGPQRR